MTVQQPGLDHQPVLSPAEVIRPVSHKQWFAKVGFFFSFTDKALIVGGQAPREGLCSSLKAQLDKGLWLPHCHKTFVQKPDQSQPALAACLQRGLPVLLAL